MSKITTQAILLLFSFSFTAVCYGQMKQIDLLPSDGKSIQLQPKFIPGQSPIEQGKMIPLDFEALDIQTLLNRDTRISPTSFNQDGQAIFFKGHLAIQKGKTIRDQVSYYMDGLGAYFPVNNITNEYGIEREEIDDIGMTHISVVQQFKGIEVESGNLKLHGKNGLITHANGVFVATPILSSVSPGITIEQAQEVVINDFKIRKIYKRIEEAEKNFVPSKTIETKLVIRGAGEEAMLVYRIDAFANLIQRFVYYIDASSGIIVDSYKNYCSFHGEIDGNHNHEGGHASIGCKGGTASEKTLNTDLAFDATTAIAKDLKNIDRTINVYETGGNFYMLDASRSMYNASQSTMPNEAVGVIWTIDAFNTNPENDDFGYDHVTSSNNSWNNKTAVSAHYNGGIAYEYFTDVHNRNSINGEGGNIISLINISDPSTGGGFDNAFWNGVAMFYGNGNTAFDPLAEALDVAGHEMSHGVVQATANLTYQGESGAMNESFADIFGAMMDRDDWFMGEDVVKTSAFPSGRLRDMSDPHNGGNQLGDPGWQPNNVSEQYMGTENNGGVHINSGIVNFAYYKFAETSGIGKEKAEKTFYRALSTYLTKSSQFVDLRAAVEQAAAELYGDTEKNAASAAFQAVGIGGGGGNTDYETDVEMNPGDDFLLHSDSELSSLFIRDNSLELIADPLSSQNHISKPSVTDNGEEIFFVGDDNNIYVISIDWQANQAGIQTFDDQGVWRNVAISKDGKRIAALTDQTNNQIIVLDFPTSAQKTFELYNPTFTEGVSTGDVNFADVMEFDFTGEWLMYDAQSTINGASGDIVYWDVGFLNVFNNASNAMAAGTVQKLFSQLPESTSVGNPTFSKNSPYIIAFDLIEGSTYKIMGANIEANQVTEIFENGGLGYPSFNNSDQQLVYEYSWLFGTDIGLIELEDNKINSTPGSETIIVEFGRFPVVFSNGERVLSEIENSDLELNLEIYPNPVGDVLTVEIPFAENASKVEVFDMTGRVIYNTDYPTNKFQLQTTSWNAGVYQIVVTINDGNKISKQVVKK